MAERVGFEPTESCNSALFKSAAFDRSATSPPERIAAAQEPTRSVARISSRVGVSAGAVSGSTFLETRNVSSPVVTMAPSCSAAKPGPPPGPTSRCVNRSRMPSPSGVSMSERVTSVSSYIPAGDSRTLAIH